MKFISVKNALILKKENAGVKYYSKKSRGWAVSTRRRRQLLAVREVNFRRVFEEKVPFGFGCCQFFIFTGFCSFTLRSNGMAMDAVELSKRFLLNEILRSFSFKFLMFIRKVSSRM